MYTFCERLKELREEKKLSYKKLAKETGFSDTALGRWERGTQIPNIETLIMLGLED